MSSDLRFADLWLVKLDTAGTILWEHSYGGTGVDQAYAVSEMADGGIVAAGSSYSLDGDVTGNHGGYDFWIIRTDSTGTLQWDKSLGGSSVEEAYSVYTNDIGKIIIAGSTLSSDGDITSNHGDFDYWIAELDEPLPDFISDTQTDYHAAFYPNPFSGITTLLLNLDKPGDATIELYDVLGKKIKTFSDKNLSPGIHSIIITAGDLEPGIYFAEVKTVGLLSMHKLIRD